MVRTPPPLHIPATTVHTLDYTMRRDPSTVSVPITIPIVNHLTIKTVMVASPSSHRHTTVLLDLLSLFECPHGQGWYRAP